MLSQAEHRKSVGYAPGTAHLNVRSGTFSLASETGLRGWLSRGLTLGNWDSGTGEEPRGLGHSTTWVPTQEEGPLTWEERKIAEVSKRVQGGDGGLL